MLGHTDHRPRTLLLMVGLLVFAVLASLRLADWQVSRASDLRVKALAQVERQMELPTKRGRILDRNGRVLALTVYRDRLVAFPKGLAGTTDTAIARRTGVVDTLAGILDVGAKGRERIAELLDDPLGDYAVIDRQLTENQSAAVAEAIAAGILPAIQLEPQPVRFYPNAGGQPGTTLASQVLGFVNAGGHGHYGIEQQYDRHLAGEPTLVAAAVDPARRLLGSSARVLEAGVDGVDIRLTIDAGLQLQLEKELFAAWNTDNAKRVSGVIMDPDTGAILAWASVPGYDANDYAGEWLRRPEIFQDPIASVFYEPGSVMKMFTAAAALDSGKVTLGTKVKDSYLLRFGPYTVRNADHRSMGREPFRDIIAYSRNVGTARTAANLGRSLNKSSTVLHRMWTRLGIGRPTGVDLANEAVGIVRDPKVVPWQPIDLANRSFGQGVAVTQIQLATGYAPMINGGFRVTPHFLGAVDGEPAARPDRERVLTAAVSGQLHQILDHVTGAVSWYAAGSLIKGWQVGGKTGTAQIWQDRQQRYSRDVFNFSFVGYVGGDDPVALVALRIEEARVTSRSQGDIVINLSSYQLFRRVAMNVIDALDIPRSDFPGAGLPEPLSAADRVLTPKRYEQHLRQRARGVDVLADVRERYTPAAERAERRAEREERRAAERAADRAAGADGRSQRRAGPGADRRGADRAVRAQDRGRSDTTTTAEPSPPPG